MTIYAMHRLSETAETVTPLEQFPSEERAVSAFKLRAEKGASGEYFMNGDLLAMPRPQAVFPGADATGCMVVWRKTPRDLPPEPGERPTEVWSLTDARVVRMQPWDKETHKHLASLRHEPTVPQLDPGHRELKDAEQDYLAEDHPGFGAECIAYWLYGRMELKDLRAGRCDCGRDDLHDSPSRVQAVMMTHAPFNLPEGTAVWFVRTGTPDPADARQMARSVAKSLGWAQNPKRAEVSS